MKSSHLFLCTLTLAAVLAACGQTVPASTQSREALMRNPLFAERYWEDLLDRMVSLVLTKDPVLADQDTAALVERIRVDAEKRAKAETAKRSAGKYASFVQVKNITEGGALLYENTLHLSTNFLSYPGPDLHLFLSAAIDPRDVTFPDEGSLDLGILQSPYGPQSYPLPEEAKQMKFSSVVLYDTTLKQIYSFGQF